LRFEDNDVKGTLLLFADNEMMLLSATSLPTLLLTMMMIIFLCMSLISLSTNNGATKMLRETDAVDHDAVGRFAADMG
jgi:hypothetical protein